MSWRALIPFSNKPSLLANKQGRLFLFTGALLFALSLYPACTAYAGSTGDTVFIVNSSAAVPDDVGTVEKHTLDMSWDAEESGFDDFDEFEDTDGIDNFFYNLGFPARFANNFLQLKFKRAGVETLRFVVNTTVGLAGLWDPAKAWLGLSSYPEDFGQTLGRYGVGSGFHLVLPVFGPSNIRDAAGRVADAFLNPVNYLDDTDEVIAASSVETVNHTSLHIGDYEAITSGALDLYIFLRDGYEQHRAKEIKE
ncbi:MAG: hypothetical protein B5M56_03545 [Desulfococcus sp. 4484_241]|nr:MAG: hypothetical protein B5M56_03545 [Desulfococcus sp. 4484_241]